MAQGPNAHLIDPNKKFSNSLLFMENAFLMFLQGLFMTFDPGVNFYHFDDDPALSEIRIEGQNTDNLKDVDPRPKIVVARGPIQMQKTGIANFVGGRNLSRVDRQYSVIRSGTVGISCYSRSDTEADRVAEICADGIDALTPLIRSLGFLEVRAMQIGQRAMIKSDSRPELFVTPVLIRVQLVKNYNVAVADPVLLREIVYKFIIDAPVSFSIPPTV